MINKELLDKIIRKSDICKFECIFDDISGVPVKYNEKYIMVNIYEDFQFDGFCIFDITEIENICYDETYEFINHICKEEKIYPPKVENINIENLDKSVITCVIIFLGGLVVYVTSLAY